MDETQVITFESEGDPTKKYFHMMLNMAEDDLDPFQYRLLGHYLRWAGHGGMMPEGIRDTAKASKMSVDKVRQAREQLETLGYLHLKIPTKEEQKKGLSVEVVVVDRWLENIQRFHKGVRNSAQGNEHKGVLNSAQGGVRNIAPLNNKSKEEQKEDSSHDGKSPDKAYVSAIQQTFGFSIYQRAIKPAAMLAGTIGEKDSRNRANGDWYDYRFEETPFSLQEIQGLGLWLPSQLDNINLTRAETIADWAGRFRQSSDYRLYMQRAGYSSASSQPPTPEPEVTNGGSPVTNPERQQYVLDRIAALARSKSS